ncbi:LysR substrate-binding domain-containing protein [Andreprevotia chitinilytica]|uniref:LysR substrate-binding domain-containing protein n=1 Tax=Andreprevotia chitinilytica TaxID=396808 RepID=UPI00068A5BBB|nr:LysR substrate-binding domain-containing protein [Andreprevotia chitinilytica]
MQLKWIGDLLALADTRSFSRAAEVRHITQSALSRRIQSLEYWVGAELVHRGTYPLELTAAGQQFCEQGREALALLLNVRSDIRRDAKMLGRAIQVTAGHSLSMTFLPKWLKQTQPRHDHFNVRVVAANVHDAVLALADGACDLMFGYHHPGAPILLDPAKFASVTLGHELFIPVSAPDARGKPLFALPGTAAAPVPYLAYTATTFLARIVDVILKQAVTPHVLERCYEADMALLLMKMAKEGYGVAWLPEGVVADELAARTLVRAGGPEWTAELEIRAYRAVQSANPTLRELWLSLLEEHQGGEHPAGGVVDK